MWVKNLAVHLNELSAIAKLIDLLVAQEVWTDQRRGIRKIQGILCHLIPISHEFLPECHLILVWPTHIYLWYVMLALCQYADIFIIIVFVERQFTKSLLCHDFLAY